jgi:hypothetical protein
MFARGKVSDGSVELRFHARDVDHHAKRTLLSYHVKVGIEGLPQHAWFLKLLRRFWGMSPSYTMLIKLPVAVRIRDS